MSFWDLFMLAATFASMAVLVTHFWTLVVIPDDPTDPGGPSSDPGPADPWPDSGYDWDGFLQRIREADRVNRPPVTCDVGNWVV